MWCVCCLRGDGGGGGVCVRARDTEHAESVSTGRGERDS